ncbi:ABC transporter ATP-binding protein [Aureliella helgolandensis]|uniref:Putative ABC transporter ATP-binding protein n=1 Tax=Aureliella helgolandensis TaxID=2527968 RepID=A0A518FZH3_9BACT|nr:ABC transporter ATP-binding protein [Aureliella helgolandensis]QDV21731.1 putative ABC transporter ATP-binding protein [Aureliella helgolandensis]
MTTLPTLLKLQHVHRRFTMGQVSVHVLKGIDLEIRQGECLAIVGPSGSGKSTILNLVGGLDQPSEGTVLYQELNLSTANRKMLTKYRRDEVGFVFQFYNLVPNLTALENVLVTTEISANPMDASEALELVGLTDRSDHFPAQLSGGEQQRVAIARAIAKRPKLLLCDEPTGALDFETGKTVLRLLIDLNEKMGTTLVIITHNAALAAVAHRVVHLRSGEVQDVVVNAHRRPPEEVQW